MKTYQVTLKLTSDDLDTLLSALALKVNWTNGTSVKQVYTEEDTEERESIGFVMEEEQRP